MTKENHIIYRQVLDISFSSRSEALSAQDEISHIYNHDLLPLINEIFDTALAAGESVRIDSLEIDVGQVRMKNLKEDLMTAVKTTLEDEIRKHIYKAPEVVGQEAGSANTAGETIAIRFGRLSDLELFVHFMQTGSLPWWVRKSKFESFEQLTIKLIENQQEALLDVVKRLIKNENQLTRLVHQLTDKALLSIIPFKNPKTREFVKEIHRELATIHNSNPFVTLSTTNFRLSIWKSTIHFWAGNRPGVSLKSILTKLHGPKKNRAKRLGIWESKLFTYYSDEEANYLIYQMSRLIANSTGQVMKASDQALELSGQTSSSGVESKLRNNLKAHLKSAKARRGVSLKIKWYEPMVVLLSHNPVDQEKESKSTRSDSHPSLEDIMQQSARASSNNGDSDQPARKDKGGGAEKGDVNTNGDSGATSSHDDARSAISLNIRPATATDDFDIQNSGLVLLWPFLSLFFEGLGLVKDNQFVTDDAAQRAALLLQYIATMETEMAEYDMVLNKVLCGLDPDTPLPGCIEVSKVEEKEVLHLLNTVVELWQVLKGTSAQGLRETFLNKSGILTREINGWKLSIERSTVDILIDKLPWSISIIKLPWNEKMLQVEW